MFRFTVIVFDLQLVIRITVLRNAEILVVAQTENHIEDGADENQTNRETNTLTKSNRFLVLGDDVNDYTGNDEQCAEQRDKAEQAQNERDQKEPAVAPINLERNVRFIERNDRCPTRLIGFREDFPVRDDVDDEECQNEQLDGTKNTENGIQSRSFC